MLQKYGTCSFVSSWSRERVWPSVWNGEWKSLLDFSWPCESNSNVNCCFVLKSLNDGQICYSTGVMG